MNEVLLLEEIKTPVKLKVFIETCGGFNKKFIFFGIKHPNIREEKIEFFYEESVNFQEKNYWKSDNYTFHLPSVLRDALLLKGYSVSRRVIEDHFILDPQRITTRREEIRFLPALAV